MLFSLTHKHKHKHKKNKNVCFSCAYSYAYALMLMLMPKWEQHKTNEWVRFSYVSAYAYAYVAGVLTCLCLCYAYALVTTSFNACAQPLFCSLILLFSDIANAVAVVVFLIINNSSGFSRKLLSSKLTKRWSVWCFWNCHQKEQLFAFSVSIQTNSNSIMFFTPAIKMER